MTTLQYQFLASPAFSPTRNNPTDAGLDLYSAEDTIIPARGRKLVKTNIAIALPPRTYGRIAPRSSMAAKNGIDVGAGVVDETYRGEVLILLINGTEENYKVSIGDKIAQLIITPILTPTPVLCDELSKTDRGEKGFGSSGATRDEWLKAWQNMPPLPVKYLTMPEEEIEAKFQEVKRQVIENAIEEYGKLDPTWKAWYDSKNTKPLVHRLPSIRHASNSIPKDIAAELRELDEKDAINEAAELRKKKEMEKFPEKAGDKP